MKEKKYSSALNDKLLIVSCILIGTMIFMRDIAGIGYSKYILLVICVWVMPFLKYSNFLCLLGFLIAVTFGIPSTYVYLIAVIFFLIKKRFKVDKFAIIIFIIFLLWEMVLSTVWQSSFGIATYIGYFSKLFFLFILIREKEDVDSKKILKFFVLGVLVFISVVVLMYLKDNSFEDILNGRVRIGEASWYLSTDSISEGMKMSTNTNNVAYFCIVGMACCLVLLNVEKKLIWSIVFFAIFALGSFTVSKTFFLLAAFLLVIYLNIMLFTKYLSFGKRLVLSAVIIAGVLILLNTGTVDALLGRFSKVDYLLQDSRTEIFWEYLNAFWDNPSCVLTGAGAFTHRTVLFPEKSTHSGLEQILVSYGVIGFGVFICYCFSAFWGEYKCVHAPRLVDRIVSITPALAILVFTQTIQFLNPTDLMLPLIIGYFALRCAESEYQQMEMRK